MSESFPDLPEVEPYDPESVAVAIETARALFRTGDRLDALRWLRRAAERAEEAGDDARAVNLARSAADLSTELQSSMPPSRNDEAAALAPYDDFSDKTVVDAPIATAIVREALQSGVQITELSQPSQAPRSVTLPSPSSSPPLPRTTLKAEPESNRPLPRAAMRVAVAPDPEGAGGWLVRPLPEGAPAPPGSEEALLIALSPRSRLFQ
ncbi:MAG TPA: hypothetical protein VHV51_10160 [Polyangiaceae bacterium]|nr:hypothetical protein [Polyangiaceae bacterium]